MGHRGRMIVVLISIMKGIVEIENRNGVVSRCAVPAVGTRGVGNEKRWAKETDINTILTVIGR